jgi:hypothetical protein
VKGQSLYIRGCIGVHGDFTPTEPPGDPQITFAQPGLISCRVMVVYDRSTNGSLPTIADMTNIQGSAAGQTGKLELACWHGMNMTKNDRFLVLRDKRWSFQHNGTSASFVEALQQQDLRFDEYIKLKGMESVYQANDAATGGSSVPPVSNLSGGGLYVVFMQDGDYGEYALNWLTLTFESRYKFLE